MNFLNKTSRNIFGFFTTNKKRYPVVNTTRRKSSSSSKSSQSSLSSKSSNSSAKSSPSSTTSSVSSTSQISGITRLQKEKAKDPDKFEGVNPMISRHTNATKKAQPILPPSIMALLPSSRRPGTKKIRGKEKSFEMIDLYPEEKGISPSSPTVNKYKQSLIKKLDKEGKEFNMLPLKIGPNDTPEQLSKKIKSKSEILSEKKDDLEKEKKLNTELRKKIAVILDEITPDKIPKMNKKQPDTLDKFLIENESLTIILGLLQNEKTVCKQKMQEYDEIVKDFKGEHPEYKGSLPKTSTKCNHKEIVANIKKIKDLNQDLLNKKKKIASKKMSGPITRSKSKKQDFESGYNDSLEGGKKKVKKM